MIAERMYPTQHILSNGGRDLNAEIHGDDIIIIWAYERKYFVRLFKNVKMTAKEFIDAVYDFPKKEV